MSLAQQLEQLLSAVKAADAQHDSQRAMLDGRFDLFNRLRDWCADTEHEKAAEEIAAILEEHVLPVPA